jgi:conjugative transfer pilus assembly protein TraH
MQSGDGKKTPPLRESCGMSKKSVFHQAKKLTVWLLVPVLLFPSSASSGLQDQLNAVFGDLKNATSPTLYMGQRRGAIVGGSFYARSRIMRPNLINFTPPGFRAGCGGIDLFGGSFSFISMDQFIQLLRSIGQNAAGYAFQIALNAICGDCLEILSDLQKKIQEFNEFFGNSCQMAKYLVDNTAGPYIQAMGETVHDILTFKGIADDAFDARVKGDPIERLSSANTPEEKKYVLGNMIWRALKSSNVDMWFGSGDNQLLESIMSLTGSVIVQQADCSNKDSEGCNYKIVHLGKILKVQDLLTGGPVDVWKCDSYDTDECLHPSKIEINLEGLDKKVQRLMDEVISGFEGTGSFSSDTKGFMENSFGVGGMVRNLYRVHPQVAKTFGNRVSPILSLEMVYVIASDMVRAARISLRKSDHPQAGEAANMLDQAWREITDEYQKLIAERGNINSVFEFYSNLITAMQPKDFEYRVGLPNSAEKTFKAE